MNGQTSRRWFLQTSSALIASGLGLRCPDTRCLGADSWPVPPEGFRTLFDGKTLSGWHAMPRPGPKPPKDAPADKAKFYEKTLQSRGRWTVRDGVLIG